MLYIAIVTLGILWWHLSLRAITSGDRVMSIFNSLDDNVTAFHFAPKVNYVTVQAWNYAFLLGFPIAALLHVVGVL